MSGAQIPLAELADIEFVSGPAMLRDENGMLSGYVFVDLAGRDVGSYVEDAKKAVQENLELPTGYTMTWSGQYENMQRVRERLKIVLPVTLFLIFILLYMNTKSAVKAGIVMLAVPFSLIGAIWYLWFLGYHISIAVWVGMIALMGLDAETGVFMLLFLDLSYDDAVRKGKMNSYEDLREAIIHGAVKRVRPKAMTVMAAMMGLLPIMWSMGTGADMMKRIAAPMIAGLVTSFIMELLVYPVIYALWKWWGEVRPRIHGVQPEPSGSELIAMAKDPICGMTVDEASGLRAERDGQTFYFCSEHCRRTFLAQGTPAESARSRASRKRNRLRQASITAQCAPASSRIHRAIVRNVGCLWSGTLAGPRRKRSSTPARCTRK